MVNWCFDGDGRPTAFGWSQQFQWRRAFNFFSGNPANIKCIVMLEMLPEGIQAIKV